MYASLAYREDAKVLKLADIGRNVMAARNDASEYGR
jgi:hypothetical protein